MAQLRTVDGSGRTVLPENGRSRRASLLVVSAMLALAFILAPLGAETQEAGRVYRLGWLATSPHPFIASFREGLRELGYVEGQNLAIEERYARPDQLPQDYHTRRGVVALVISNTLQDGLSSETRPVR